MPLDLQFSEGVRVKVLMGEATNVAVRHITNRPNGAEPFVTIEIIDDDGSATVYMSESLAGRLCEMLSPFGLNRPIDFPAAVDPVAAIEKKGDSR